MATRPVYGSAIRRAFALLLMFLVTAAMLLAAGPGFRSKRQFDDHFDKHGAEFGKITQEQYLKMAQEFRDAPVSAVVLELRRADGVVTRFHKKNGWFLAFNKDRTIRTFFIPNDGERYFRRQAQTSH